MSIYDAIIIGILCAGAFAAMCWALVGALLWWLDTNRVINGESNGDQEAE